MSKGVTEHSTRTLKRMATRQLKRIWRKEDYWNRNSGSGPYSWYPEDKARSEIDWLETIRTELTRRGERV